MVSGLLCGFLAFTVTEVGSYRWILNKGQLSLICILKWSLRLPVESKLDRGQKQGDQEGDCCRYPRERRWWLGLGWYEEDGEK